ncbi:uncharacterized protein PHACADRAFT_109893 [Phanerochaete carnosa HHB-10118-sp]|uniref:ABC transporter domain-containing protein n=1 Tax=Phanerochaete carnosa (strain HHB-10118-sp) TaxID=650164 RepID=K5XBT6_PHACS|nr:uncharacterized protein PHACADRAFT_109893 [Phanerochaete carnosa HHB-10118-sp]EKM60432.1 hypothetical protein PHACADRAFT_109893 [Phanerochaete carnosa HHB-10118-sp]
MGGRRRGASRRITSRKGVFNPEDTKRVKHTRIGVWDLYEEKIPELERVPGLSRLERFLTLKQTLPYVWRMVKDIGSIRSCWLLLTLYLILDLVGALVPAAVLWYKGQLLTIVQVAVDSRTVDKSLLVRVTFGMWVCKILTRLLKYAKSHITLPLKARLKQHYSVHLFAARARLDVPTFEDPSVQRQLDSASHVNGQSVAWGTFTMLSGLVTTAIKVVTQTSVLARVLKDQQDGTLLAVVSLVPELVQWMQWQKVTLHGGEQGLCEASGPQTSLFKHALNRVGDYADDFYETYREYRNREQLGPGIFLRDSLSELPQIAFALRAVQQPAFIPVSLASLSLIQENTSSLTWAIGRFFEQTGSIADQLATVRKLYESSHIPNRIRDGDTPFPEDTQKVHAGISVEFRNVSFAYPGARSFALKGVSFKLEMGQLCVLVGANGSGKSTILKLMIRLYDPVEGQILIDGKDIRSLKLADLRQAASVLFQDYTHFPLSIRDNIALGDPAHADDDERIRLAAQLGGSEELVDRLPDGFDTYLERPVTDHYSGLPEGTKTLFGRPVDYNSVRMAGNMAATAATSLSGGQMQRLALSRTFMRSVVSEDSQVGLLLFDEPSASLDPTAEHDLFVRLRELRGNKTMIFSSHRFGNLTRHADLILYMDDSSIVESGTHEQLLRKEGEYARIWKLQAQAFL